MADKAKPAGISQRKATEDDVEGHSLHTARASEGIAHAKAPAGLSQRKATEDDVEGHSLHTARAIEGVAHAKAPAGISQRKATEDDDVEGHSMILDPGIARQLAQARERDVQQNLKRHQVERDARSARKDGR